MTDALPRVRRPQLAWLALAVATLGLHLLTNGRYGYFRDELYFIACAKHMAWGFVDQPPLAPAAAWLSAPFAYALPALRLLPALAAAATVYVACLIAADLGGGRFAQLLAGLAAMLAPAYLLLGNALVTTSFEPLSWSLLALTVLRAVNRRDPRWWIAAAVAFAFGFYGKYTIALFGLALAIGFAFTRERRALGSWWFAAALVLAGVLVLPNVAWQFREGLPMIDVLRNEFTGRNAFPPVLQLDFSNLARNAAAFVIEQALYAGPIALPLWLLGLAGYLIDPRLARARMLGIAYLVLVALAIVFKAKGYYIIGIYAVLFAAGAVVLERVWASVAVGFSRPATIVALVLFSLPLVPLAIPVLSVPHLIAYSAALGMTGRNGSARHLIQPFFAEEFGWDELAARVAQVYRALPPAERKRAGIFADTYGDAAALDFFGPRYGLPPAISGQNAYYLWGPRDYDGSVLVAVGASQANVLQAYFRNVRLVATYVHPYRWVMEGPDPIWICTGSRVPLRALWSKFKWFGA